LLRLIAEVEVPPMLEPTEGNGVGEHQFSGFTCPECRGPLFRHRTNPIEFKCRVGHVFPLKTLIEEETSTQERKLYEAIVSLDEGADLAEYTASLKSQESRRESLRNEAKQLREHAAAIRKILQERTATPLT
jgi:two-component system, chemotaxis family, protein-glutamate methylesterase/glutaminase